MTTAIIQARMSSTRLPGKVLADICGKPMLERMIDRVNKAKTLEQIVVATSDDPSDEPIVRLCEEKKWNFFKGSSGDVLSRYYHAAKGFHADPVIRLTADCPLIDPDLVDRHVSYYQRHRDVVHYVANVIKPTYPDGMDISVFSFSVLTQAFQEAKLASEREHVVPWMWKNCDLGGGRRFVAKNIESEEDLSRLRLTVDEPEDLVVIRNIFSHFLREGLPFGLKDIINFVNGNPSLVAANRNFVRDFGYSRSLEKDSHN